MERETGIEPATFSLARRCSTTEPLPLVRYVCETKIAYQGRFVNNLIVRSTMRADKVFKVIYNGEDAILEIEFESGTDSDLPSRLLIYNAVLYQQHKLPVITILVYPFPVPLPESPLQVAIGANIIFTFHFQMLGKVQMNLTVPQQQQGP